MLNSGYVTVVGSANLDVVITLGRFPQPGETVLGDRYAEVAGGKGLNQAIAAARKATSTFVGCIGDDEAGALLGQVLDQAGVETQFLMRRSKPTGRAFIQVTPDGNNAIVVMALANNTLDAESVVVALDSLRPAVVLTQLEIPVEVVAASASWAESNGATFLLNPSPIRDVPRSTLELCDPLIVNAAEARAILRTGGQHEPSSPKQTSPADLAGLVAKLARSVVVTDGGGGAYVGTVRGGIAKIPGKAVTAVDTTGAGDEFAGVLAGGLAFGLPLEAAAELANEAAARLVQLPRGQR